MIGELAKAAQEQQQANAATNAQLAGTAASMLARQFDPNQKAYRAQLKRDREALKANEFGPSTGEKLRQAAMLTKQRMAATRGVEQQLDREAAAMGFGRSGVQGAARTALADQEAANAAAGMGAIEQAATQQALAEKAGAMSRLTGQAMQNIQSWYDLGSAVGAKMSGGVKMPGRAATQEALEGVTDEAEVARKANEAAKTEAKAHRAQSRALANDRYLITAETEY